MATAVVGAPADPARAAAVGRTLNALPVAIAPSAHRPIGRLATADLVRAVAVHVRGHL